MGKVGRVVHPVEISRSKTAHSLRAVLREFAKREDGSAAVEYSLMAAVMCVAVIAAFGALDLTSNFGAVVDLVAGLIGAE